MINRRFSSKALRMRSAAVCSTQFKSIACKYTLSGSTSRSSCDPLNPANFSTCVYQGSRSSCDLRQHLGAFGYFRAEIVAKALGRLRLGLGGFFLFGHGQFPPGLECRASSKRWNPRGQAEPHLPYRRVGKQKVKWAGSDPMFRARNNRSLCGPIASCHRRLVGTSVEHGYHRP